MSSLIGMGRSWWVERAATRQTGSSTVGNAPELPAPGPLGPSLADYVIATGLTDEAGAAGGH
jgi:hypothetical protein